MMTPPHATPVDSTESRMRRSEQTSQRLEVLLEVLPPAQRHVAILLAEGYSPAQVADIRQTSVSAVYRQMRRIRTLLAEAVDP